MSPAPKQFDIVVYGATGFTGQLIVSYLNSQAPKQGTSWAIAGRSRAKLSATAKQLGVDGVAIIVADSSDEDALREMARQTKVVLTVVGPFNIYGKTLAKVCAEEGTHYLDLNGEAHFGQFIIQNYHSKAQSTGALMIPASGFDSVPSDLCTFLAVQALKKAGDGQPVSAGEVVSRFSAKGTPSGGTVATALEMISNATPDERRANADPYALSPVKGQGTRSLFLAASSSFAGRREWGGFWFMAGANQAIVNRSFGLLQQYSPKLAYGSEFKYREMFAAKSRLAATIQSAVLYLGFATLILFPPARWALKRYLPAGDGPSKQDQDAGWFKVATTAQSAPPRFEARATVKAKGDPGYKATSRMIVQSALAIVHDWDRLSEMARKGGILTPATALGEVLVERLEQTGEFEFSTEVGGKKL